MAVDRYPEFTPAGVLTDARAQILNLTDTLWAGRTDGELVGAVEEIQALRSTLAALEAGAVAEIEAGGIAKSVLHYGSTADWLTHTGGLRRGEGRRILARAQALTTTMSATRQALADGGVSPEQASVIVTAVDALLPLTCPQPTINETGEQVPDPRDGGARMWDALILSAQHALTTDLPPTTHGATPRLAMTLSHADLVAGLGHAVTDDGLELPAGVVRRLACDADIIPVVLATQSEVLDVGRTHRLVTPAIWQTLVVRDSHCTFPTCRRPPIMCHAHHLHHWLDHGPTELDNLALLCGHHHRTIHNTPWEIRLNNNDKRPEFKPPPRRDVDSGYARWRRRLE